MKKFLINLCALMIVFVTVTPVLSAEEQVINNKQYFNHNPSYLIFTHSTDLPDSVNNLGARFQLSMAMTFPKVLLHRLPVFDAGRMRTTFDITSDWNIFGESKPFYNHDFQPQVFYEWQLNYFLEMIRTGEHHQSNGTAASTSRSWDRLFGSVYGDLNSIAPGLKLELTGWYVWAYGSNSDSMKEYANFDNSDFGGRIVLREQYKMINAAIYLQKNSQNVETSYRFTDSDVSIFGLYHNGYFWNSLSFNKDTDAWGFGLSKDF